ncbi:hypothetical protein B5807_07222 [Epicoccum nigrum]|uniref:Uncharacterized protein n=1 Tax=Epicoccum nigrum TaxID=105696 RepID=A0A1Y2LUG4_EPING|nr:hypothetical protein B5807_07222 [Epicoccum nigrum]
MGIINGNIKLELSNVGTLTNQPKIDLVPMWNAFLAQHFTKAENWGVTVVAAVEKKIVTLKNSRKGKTSAQKDVITREIDLGKKKLKKELKKQGLIQRSIHELYLD